MFRLGSVRAKLTALVSLSVVVMLAALPVLSWLMHSQLTEEVQERVHDAEASLDSELADDLDDLTLAARLLAASPETREAIAAHDPSRALVAAREFTAVYPEIDVLFFDERGALLAQFGCENPVQTVADLPSANVAGTRGLIAHGCERGPNAVPAFAIGGAVEGGGAVVLCLPLNQAWLANAAGKLGVQLALNDERGVSLEATRAFPGAAAAVKGARPELRSHQSRTWAVGSFSPHAFGPDAPWSISAALDVTDIRAIVWKHLLGALLMLLVAAVISLAFGLRVAAVMSVALTRVNTALKKLEQQEYVHVEQVTTGDELEDLAAGFNQMVDGLKERDHLRATMGKYMTESVVQHLLAGKIQLGGESLKVTILFSDIRSFTTISEKMDAHALVSLLNEYFTEMVSVVIAESGVVDKYIGDAIMAVFGAPVPKEGDALHAVRAAVGMRVALQKLNERLVARGHPPIDTGIGLHTGEVVAGNIGSEQRMEYTVIGDAVNLASRLESATKEHHVDILISDDTYQLVKEEVVARAVKEITIKGRTQPVMTWEVLGLKGQPPLKA